MKFIAHIGMTSPAKIEHSLNRLMEKERHDFTQRGRCIEVMQILFQVNPQYRYTQGKGNLAVVLKRFKAENKIKIGRLKNGKIT